LQKFQGPQGIAAKLPIDGLAEQFLLTPIG